MYAISVIRWVCKPMQWWLCIGLVILLVQAASAGEARGIQWLQGQIQANGQLIDEPGSSALPAQIRTETALALDVLAKPLPPNLQPAIDALDGPTVEILARKSLAQQLTAVDPVHLPALVQQQNADGGFGAAKGQGSNVLDTAWALAALAQSNAAQGAPIAQALGWLLAAQQADGRWALAPDGDALVPTAQVARALQAHRRASGVAAALGKARQWLLSQRSAAPSWGSPARDALSLLAVLAGMPTADAAAQAVQTLKAAQRSNGSWEDDSYTTALALQALAWAGRPVTNPDLASLDLIVLDADTDAPVSGALVRLAQRALQGSTDAQGRVNFTQLVQGPDRLDIEAPGYRPVSSPIQLQAGQRLDLGPIRLKAATSASSGVTLSGVARYFNGSAYSPANGARISAGGQTTTADRTGAYRLEGLVAGSIAISASYSSYPSIQASTTAQAGQVVEFNPVFQFQPNSTARLTVVVTDAATGHPLPGAVAALPGTIRRTDTTGRAVFTSGLKTGTNQVTISRPAYEQALVSFDIVDGRGLEISVALAPVTGNQTVLRGVVTDADTQQPLAGVGVSVADPPLRATTDAQGTYSLTHAQLAGTRTVEFGLAGYLAHTQTVSIASAAVSVFNVPLRQQSQASGQARLDVSVVQRGAGLPLAGAAIEVSGANRHTVAADADGKASLSGLQPGATQVMVSAPGFESAMASVTVKPGQIYRLPVELQPLTSPLQKLYGQVIDAVSQQPVSGAQISLSGAITASTTSAANGYYEFDGVAPGEVVLDAARTGYVALQKSFRLDGTTEVKLPLTPAWQPVPGSAWQVFGSVVDADTLEPLVGADLVLEEVLPGSAVISTVRGSTRLGGSFSFDGLTQTHARISVSLNGYDTALLPFSRLADSQALGTIKLKRSYDAALPDLMLSRPDRSALVHDENTFKASGKITARVTNNSNYDAGGFDAIAFLDNDGDQLWDPARDRLLSKLRVPALAAQQSLPLEWDLAPFQLPFRDAPIYLMADSALEVIENIEGNNSLRVGVSCAGGGGVQDVGVCIDTSGSVAHLYNLEMDGVIKAVENPNIIPHDGSIRFMLGTDYEMYYGSDITPLHEARILTPAVLPQLIQDLRSKRNPGGYSSGPTCVRRMSEYMKSLPQTSGSRTVITVGDGYWEGIAKAQSELPNTVANGVGRVDVIGIGSVNLPELEANAWPKPANSLHGGKVTVAYSASEVATAMAQALGAAAQSVDLTLGSLRLVDKGAGRPLALRARIGNAGSPSQPASVRFHQGTGLLGEIAIQALQTGEWVDVELPEARLSGSEPLRAVVDEGRANAECNTANNRQQIDVAAANRVAGLKVQTDQASYPSNAPVQLGAMAQNLGSFAAEFSLVLTIEDARGIEVARFNAADLGSLDAGASRHHAQPWGTGSVRAGSYVLRGWLLDSDGAVAAEDRTLFAIVAGTGIGATGAGITVSTDRKVYAPDARVRIDKLARNLAANAPLDDAMIALTVRDPQGTVVLTHEYPAQQIAPNGLRSESLVQRLVAAPTGMHAVDAQLLDGRRQVVASASTRYEVVAGNRLPPPAEGLGGSVALARSSLRAGEAQARDDTVHNTGTTDWKGLKVARVIASEDGRELHRQDTVIDLSPGARHQWPASPVPTAALRPGGHVALLIADIGGSPVVLDQQSFQVVDGAPAQAHPIPALGSGALLLLSLLVPGAALAAARARRRGHGGPR